MSTTDHKNGASKSAADAPDYDVGYGKPPIGSRFKPGRSGNPKGRPKGSNNLKTDLAEELAERVQVTENGRRIKVSKQRLVVKALTAKAVKGDTRAATVLIGLLTQTFGLDPPDQRKPDLPHDDEAILAGFLDHLVAGRKKEAVGDGK